MSRWKYVLIIVILIVIGVALWRWHAHARDEAAAAEAAGRNDAPVPVTVVAVTQKDVPVYLTALGTVQALNTVTVNSQVSGQLKSLHFDEGDEIKQGDLIAEIDPRTFQAAYDQANAKTKQDQALLSAARSTQKRYEDLIVKHFVAAQDLENQRQSVKQQEALIVADQAAAASAKTQLGYTRITSPITGVAGIRQVDVGNLVTANNSTGIVTLTQVHPINVIFTLPEQYLGEVRKGEATGALEVRALDRSDSHPLASGTLKVIDNQIDTTTGTFKLKSEFANADNILWPGQFVNVQLKVSTISGGLVAPVSAIQRGPDGSFVYVLQPDNTVAVKPITIGGDAGDAGTVISKGVAAGDKVVTEGQFRLKAGAKVQALAPGEAAPPTSAAELDKLKAADDGKGQRRRGGGGGRRGG